MAGFSVAGRNAIAEEPIYRKWQGLPPPVSSTAVGESRIRARPGQYRWEPYSNGLRRSSLGSGAQRNERDSHGQGSLMAKKERRPSESEWNGWKISSSPFQVEKKGRSRSPVREAVKNGTHSRRAKSQSRSTKPHMEVKPAISKEEHLPTRALQYRTKKSSNKDSSGNLPECSNSFQNNDNQHNLSTHQNHAPPMIKSHTTSPGYNTTNRVEMSEHQKFNLSSDSLVTAYRANPTEGKPASETFVWVRKLTC